MPQTGRHVAGSKCGLLPAGNQTPGRFLDGLCESLGVAGSAGVSFSSVVLGDAGAGVVGLVVELAVGVAVSTGKLFSSVHS